MTKEMEKKNNANIYSAVTLAISGMHCESCVGRIETALLRLAGVVDAEVDLAEHKAEISFDSEKVSVDDLKASVEAEGYHILDENKKGADPKTECCSAFFNWSSNPRSYLYGVLASIAIVGVYLGMNTLTADWYFARVQFSEYRWWILTLAIGFGIQVTLFTLFRAQLRGQKMRAVKSSVAASGGMSATAMMACCSHYLAAVIPALGVPFLSATAVARLAEYQTYFFLAGVISCLVGIGLILRMMEKHGMIRNPILKNFFTFRMARIRGSG
jgi:cation transport ATPase